MRITSEVLVTRTLDRLQTRLQAYERSQSQLATGRKILAPSDDPGGARRAMSLRASMSSRHQELRNIDDATGWLNNADTQLQSAMERTRRARDLTVEGATIKDPGARQALATELRAIADELVGIANTQHNGRPLFGGFSAGAAVTEVDGELVFDPPPGQADRVLRRVSDTEQVRVNVTAAEWLGAIDGPAADPADPVDPDAPVVDANLVALLRRLADDIAAGDQAAASTGLAAIDQASDRIGATLAEIGSAANRVESARQRAETASLTLRTELSNVEDIDVAQGVMEMQIQEIGYQATLQALSRALPPSLASFLG